MSLAEVFLFNCIDLGRKLDAQLLQKLTFRFQHFETQTSWSHCGQRLLGACGVDPHSSQTAFNFLFG